MLITCALNSLSPGHVSLGSYALFVLLKTRLTAKSTCPCLLTLKTEVRAMQVIDSLVLFTQVEAETAAQCLSMSSPDRGSADS